MKSAVFLVVLLFASLALAQKKSSLQRFGESDMQTVNTKVRFTTLIQLPEGEEISEVTCGDKEFWVIEGKDGMVYVKPSKEGAVTNVNVISKSKVVYSFLVREITKPGGVSKEKVDLKVILAADEVPKLRKDKENLEAALAKSERSVKDLNDKADSESSKKKEDAEVEAPKLPIDTVSKPASGPKPMPDLKATLDAKPKAEPAPVPAPAPPVRMQAPIPPIEEQPIAKVYTIERQDGLIRKIGHFFRKVGQALRLY